MKNCTCKLWICRFVQSSRLTINPKSNEEDHREYEKRQARRDDYRTVGRRRQGRRRRRLNWCNELIDWRCLRDRHRYTPRTRLHVRWLSAQRRSASLSIIGCVRATLCPAYPVRDQPPPLAHRHHQRRHLALWQKERQVRRTVSVPNMFSTLRAASLFSRRVWIVCPRSSLSPSRFVASHPLSSKLAAKSHCRLNSSSCNIFFFFIAAYISHAWESRQGESLIPRGRSIMREKQSISFGKFGRDACFLPASSIVFRNNR